MTKEDEINFWWEMYAEAHRQGRRSNTRLALKELKKLGVWSKVKVEFKSCDNLNNTKTILSPVVLELFSEDSLKETIINAIKKPGIESVIISKINSEE